MARLTKTSYVKIILVCLLCLVICGTLTGGFYFINQAIYAWRSPWNDYTSSWVSDESAGGFEVDAETVNDIAISWLAGKVTVETVEDSETDGKIIVSEVNVRQPDLRWRNSGGRLEIVYGTSGLLSCSALSFGHKELTVLIPKSRCGELGEINLDAASGQYRLSGIECDNLIVNQASGDIDFEDFSAGAMTVNMASGAFNYSGKISDALDIDQASGRADINLISENPHHSKLSLVSGDLTLSLPKPDFSVELEKVSGSFNSDYKLISEGNVFYSSDDDSNEEHDSHLSIDTENTSRISVEMMSGNFNIRKS